MSSKYCRYCAFCINGDGYYCTSKDKVITNPHQKVQCSDYAQSELGDVDTGKPYRPQRLKARNGCEQMKMDLGKVVDNH